jgi:hypothetical protein
MKPAFHFTRETTWRSAPMAFWVHVPIPETADAFDPPAPQAAPRLGYAVLHVAFGSHELRFSALAQLDHMIEVLSRKPLPTSRQLSSRRGTSAGPNGHWLSRLPARLKSPRQRGQLVRALQEIRAQVASSWSGHPPQAGARSRRQAP